MLVQLVLPRELRLQGIVEEPEVRSQFGGHGVECVWHYGDGTFVRFGTSTTALAAFLQLPAAFAGRAALNNCDMTRLLCYNVPFLVSQDKVKRGLLAQAGLPDSVKCKLQTSQGRTELVKTVAVTFGDASVAVNVATKVHQLQLDVALDNKPLLEVKATAEALLQKLQEDQVARTRLARSPEGMADSSAASEAASDGAPPGAPLRPPSPMAYPEAQQKLEAISGERVGHRDPGALRRCIAEVVQACWPPVRKSKGLCRRHKLCEVGQASLRCEGPDGRGEDSCEWEHRLAPCRDGDACKSLGRTGPGVNAPCCRVHPKELQQLLSLDCHLEAEVGSQTGLTLEVLRRGLAGHRHKMLRQADELLQRSSQWIADAKARVEQEREQPYEETTKGMQRRRRILDAAEQKVEELEKQREEFQGARGAFLEARGDSFSAARLFAREVYNRFPACLPIYAERAAILGHLTEDFAVLVLSAETGSGKSTQVVQYVSEVAPGRVLCMQPRRLAAERLAERVAKEMQVGPQSDYVSHHSARGASPRGARCSSSPTPCCSTRSRATRRCGR